MAEKDENNTRESKRRFIDYSKNVTYAIERVSEKISDLNDNACDLKQELEALKTYLENGSEILECVSQSIHVPMRGKSGRQNSAVTELKDSGVISGISVNSTDSITQGGDSETEQRPSFGRDSERRKGHYFHEGPEDLTTGGENLAVRAFTQSENKKEKQQMKIEFEKKKQDLIREMAKLNRVTEEQESAVQDKMEMDRLVAECVRIKNENSEKTLGETLCGRRSVNGNEIAHPHGQTSPTVSPEPPPFPSTVA